MRTLSVASVLASVDLFPQPPRRPQRPGRGTEKGARRSFIGAIRRELGRAAEEISPVTPHLTNYPY